MELFENLLWGGGRVRGVGEGKTKLNLARDNARLLAWALAPNAIPSRFLLSLIVVEDFLKRKVEFAKVVFAKAVLIPADDIEDEVIGRGKRDYFRHVPFGVQGLGNGVGDNTVVTAGENEILMGGRTCQYS